MNAITNHPTADQQATGRSERVFRTLLCVVDGSGPSCRAAEVAVKLALSHNARLVFASVATWETVPVDVERYLEGESHGSAGWRELPFLPNDAKNCLDGALAVAARAGVEHAEGMIVTEDPGKGIVDALREVSADCVVLGSRWQSALVETIFGSAYRSISRETDAPILLVR